MDQGKVVASENEYIWKVTPKEYDDPQFVGFIDIRTIIDGNEKALTTDSEDWTDETVILSPIIPQNNYYKMYQEWNVHWV